MVKNLRLKLLALILAGGLWIIVMNSSEGVHKFGEGVPVRLFNLDPEMVVTNKDTLEPVKIFLRGPKDSMKNLKAEDFNVYVNLNGLSKGRHDLLVQVNMEKQQEARIAKIEPSQLQLILEPKITKTLPVVVITEGRVSDDFAFHAPTAAITSAKATGANSIINQAVEAIVLLKFTGEEESDVEKSLPLTARNDKGIFLSNLEIVPTTVKVSAVLERISHSKTVGVKATLSQKPLAEGYWLKNVEVEPATITIKGEPASLKRIDFIPTAEIDVEGLSRDVKKRVDLQLPRGVMLGNPSSDTVTVKVQVATSSTKRTVFASILPENLSGVKIEKLEPASIKIELEGSLEAINSLKESDVFFSINLLGEKEGGRELVLDKKNLTLPQGIKLVSFNPDTVKVTLVKLIEKETSSGQGMDKSEDIVKDTNVVDGKDGAKQDNIQYDADSGSAKSPTD